MTIKEAFEYLSSECGIGMKNPFIALRNLVEAFGKVADEVDPTPSGDFVKKSGDTMTGDLNVEGGDVTCSVVKPLMVQFNSIGLGGAIDLLGRFSGSQKVQIEIPQKGGTMALKNDIASYSTNEQWVGTWIDGSRIYQKTVEIDSVAYNDWTDVFFLADIDIKGYDSRTSYAQLNNGQRVQLDWFVTASIYNRSIITDNSTKFKVETKGNSYSKIVATIYYTKTN